MDAFHIKWWWIPIALFDFLIRGGWVAVLYLPSKSPYGSDQEVP